jgi:predicted small lipoprotein YifL
MKNVRLLLALTCLIAAAACGRTHPLSPALDGPEGTQVVRPAEPSRSVAPLPTGIPPVQPDSVGAPPPPGGDHGSGN